MPTSQAKGVLTDIGTEELAHMEIVAALVYNLVKGATISEIKAAGMEGYYADHDRALYFVNGDGGPMDSLIHPVQGDPIADLHENMAAEEKARATYEHLINLSDDPLVTDVLRFCGTRGSAFPAIRRDLKHSPRFSQLPKSVVILDNNDSN